MDALSAEINLLIQQSLSAVYHAKPDLSSVPHPDRIGHAVESLSNTRAAIVALEKTRAGRRLSAHSAYRRRWNELAKHLGDSCSELQRYV